MDKTQGPAAPPSSLQQAWAPDPQRQAFLPPSPEQRCPEWAWRLSPRGASERCAVLGSRRRAGPGALCGRVAGRADSDLLSLSPAAGTASAVPEAACPCPNTQALLPCSDIITSPYFRGKEAAGCAPGHLRSASCLAALCLLPHGHPKPPSHARAPRCVSCVSSSVERVRVPRRQLLVSGKASSKVGRGFRTYPTPHLGWLQSSYLSHSHVISLSARRAWGTACHSHQEVSAASFHGGRAPCVVAALPRAQTCLSAPPMPRHMCVNQPRRRASPWVMDCIVPSDSSADVLSPREPAIGKASLGEY